MAWGNPCLNQKKMISRRNVSLFGNPYPKTSPKNSHGNVWSWRGLHSQITSTWPGTRSPKMEVTKITPWIGQESGMKPHKCHEHKNLSVGFQVNTCCLSFLNHPFIERSSMVLAHSLATLVWKAGAKKVVENCWNCCWWKHVERFLSSFPQFRQSPHFLSKHLSVSIW